MSITLRKTLDFDLVSEFDAALDREASDLAAYRESGDRAHLKFTAGERPTVFHCRALSQAAMRKARGALTVSERGVSGMTELAEIAFLHGVKDVAELYGPDGRAAVVTESDFIRGEDRLSTTWLKKWDLPQELVDEIGGWIFRRSQLETPDLKNC